MEKFNLTKNKKITALIIGSITAISLINCTPQKQTIDNSSLVDNTTKEVEYIADKGIETYEDEKKQYEKNDEVIYDYIDSLKEDFKDLKEYGTEKWNSKQFQEKLSKAKEKLNTLIDFVFNGKEINGITFNDLSEEAKRNVKQSVYDLDEMINELFPNYKERIYEWLVEQGANGLEQLDNLKEDYNTYKEDVLEEYNNSKKIKVKK